MPRRTTTLVFLVKRSAGKISEVCLAMKKRGFGVGKWNGVGGKVKETESVEDAAVRESHEEIGVTLGTVQKVADLHFTFPHNSAWDQHCHVHLCEFWKNEPSETEEMRPRWFPTGTLPYESMWSDDPFWLPLILEDRLVKAAFTFGTNDETLGKEVAVVEKL